MKSWIVEFKAGRKDELKWKSGKIIFQRDLISPFFEVITMMSLIYILRKCSCVSKHHKSQEMINHLMNMDDIKLRAKKEKGLENLIQPVRIYYEISGMDFQHWKILRANNNKWREKSSSSSCRETNTNIPDPLSPLLPIIHRFWQVFRVTSRILT